MDFLKAEIARKKKQLEQSKVVDPESGKQFFKRGDLMKQQEEHYWKRHKKDDGAVSEDASRKKVRRESTELMDPNLVTLSRQEVIKRLRDRQEPIRLFGELDTEAFFRLRRYEMLAPEINKGLRNDFKEAMDKVDQQYLEEMVKLQGEDVPNRAYDIKFEDDGSTIDDIIKMSAGMGQGNDHDEQDSKVIVHYIKFLLKMWAQELNRREEHVKRSNNGKLESATYSQTKGYLQPLLRKLNKQSLAPDLLDSLVTIVRFMLDRDYVKASDTYLQMAIGNAPWPIGVTMVGIHARTGREKIFSKNVAHVLNDETQRKFIQALKRLMTQCQRHYPTVPSRSVEYVKSDIVEHSH